MFQYSAVCDMSKIDVEAVILLKVIFIFGITVYFFKFVTNFSRKKDDIFI